MTQLDLKENEIYHFVLSNSVIIGKFLGESEDFLRISKPYLLLSDGQQLVIIPYLAEILNQELEVLELSKNQLVSKPIEIDKSSSVYTEYVKAATGIEVAGSPKELILG